MLMSIYTKQCIVRFTIFVLWRLHRRALPFGQRVRFLHTAKVRFCGWARADKKNSLTHIRYLQCGALWHGAYFNPLQSGSTSPTRPYTTNCSLGLPESKKINNNGVARCLICGLPPRPLTFFHFTLQ
jgi:hypothetical protein